MNTACITKKNLALAKISAQRGDLNFKSGLEQGFEQGFEPGFEPGFELVTEPGFQPRFELR